MKKIQVGLGVVRVVKYLLQKNKDLSSTFQNQHKKAEVVAFDYNLGDEEMKTGGFLRSAIQPD